MSLEKLVGKSVNIGTNKVSYGLDDHIAQYFSAVGSLPSRVLYMNPQIADYPTEDTSKAVLDYVSKSSLKDTHIKIGYNGVLEDIRKVASNKNINFFKRIFVGVPMTILAGILSKYTRIGDYNPFTRTVHIYSRDKENALHTLGLAEHIQNSNHPVLFYLSKLLVIPHFIQTYKAMKNVYAKAKVNKFKYTMHYLPNAIRPYLNSAVTILLFPFIRTTYIANKIGEWAEKLTNQPEAKPATN